MGTYYSTRIGCFLTVPDITVEINVESFVCSSCGKKHKEKSKFCSNCGNSVNTINTAKSETRRLYYLDIDDDDIKDLIMLTEYLTYNDETVVLTNINGYDTTWGSREDECHIIDPSLIQEQIELFMAHFKPVIEYIENKFNVKTTVRYGVVTYGM